MWTLFHIPFSGLVQEIHEYCQACSSHWDNRVCMTNVLACLLSPFSHVQLFAILWTAARQAPLSIGFSREEYWSGLPFPPPGESSWPGDWTRISYVSCRGWRALYHCDLCLVSHCVRLFATSWIVPFQVPLSMGIFQARILEWVTMLSSRGSSQPKDQTRSPTLQADSWPSEPPGKPLAPPNLQQSEWPFTNP